MKPDKLDLEINADEDDAAAEMEDIIAGYLEYLFCVLSFCLAATFVHVV